MYVIENLLILLIDKIPYHLSIFCTTSIDEHVVHVSVGPQARKKSSQQISIHKWQVYYRYVVFQIVETCHQQPQLSRSYAMISSFQNELTRHSCEHSIVSHICIEYTELSVCQCGLILRRKLKLPVYSNANNFFRMEVLFL